MTRRGHLLTRMLSTSRGPIARSTFRTVSVLGLRLVVQAGWLLLITRMLGQHDYGLLAGSSSLAFGLGTIANVGFNYVVMARTARNIDDGLNAWRLAWPVTTCFGIVLAVLYIAYAGRSLGFPGIDHGFLVAIALSELVVIPNLNNVSAAMHGAGRVASSQMMQLAPFILRLMAIGVCYLAIAEQRLALYAWLHLLAAVFATFGAIAVARRTIALDLGVRRPSWEEWKQGASFAVMSFTALNPAELDKAVALRALGAAPAGLYAAATRTLAATVTPVIGLLLSSQPRLFRHAHVHDPGAARLVTIIMLAATAWGLVANAALLAFAVPLSRLFGQHFDGLAGMLSMVSWAAVPMALRISAGAVIMALEKPGMRALYEIVGLACLVTLMMVLIPHYGLAGAGMALVASETLFAVMGVAMTLRCLRQLRRPSPAA